MASILSIPLILPCQAVVPTTQSVGTLGGSKSLTVELGT